MKLEPIANQEEKKNIFKTKFDECNQNPYCRGGKRKEARKTNEKSKCHGYTAINQGKIRLAANCSRTKE